jgi:stage II sporulation protein D
VAARSYALATDAGGAVFDQYPDTRSQVYSGADGEQPRTNAAVSDTANEVLRYGGVIAATYFFSTSGGRTEDIQNVFYGAEPAPYLVSVNDPYDNLSPKHRWRMVMSKRAFVAKLGSLVQGRYRGIKVLQRGRSPRIVWAAIVGTKGTTRVRGATLRTKLGLFDTWASFNKFTGKVKTTPVTAPPISPGGGTPGTSTGVARPARLPRMGALLYGSISPAPSKRNAVLQLARADGTWRTVRHFHLRKGGAYRLKVSLPGTYRVVAGPLVGPSLTV